MIKQNRCLAGRLLCSGHCAQCGPVTLYPRLNDPQRPRRPNRGAERWRRSHAVIVRSGRSSTLSHSGPHRVPIPPLHRSGSSAPLAGHPSRPGRVSKGTSEQHRTALRTQEPDSARVTSRSCFCCSTIHALDSACDNIPQITSQLLKSAMSPVNRASSCLFNDY